MWQQVAPPGGLLGDTRWSSSEDACGILIPLGHLLRCEGGSAPGPRAVRGCTAGAQCPGHAWHWEAPPQWLPCSPLRGGARKVLPCSDHLGPMTAWRRSLRVSRCQTCCPGSLVATGRPRILPWNRCCGGQRHQEPARGDGCRWQRGRWPSREQGVGEG